jgi:hypothetical protein
LLPVLGSSHDIHNAERLRRNDAHRTGNRLLAIPECGKDAWLRRGR